MKKMSSFKKNIYTFIFSFTFLICGIFGALIINPIGSVSAAEESEQEVSVPFVEQNSTSVAGPKSYFFVEHLNKDKTYSNAEPQLAYNNGVVFLNDDTDGVVFSFGRRDDVDGSKINGVNHPIASYGSTKLSTTSINSFVNIALKINDVEATGYSETAETTTGGESPVVYNYYFRYINYSLLVEGKYEFTITYNFNDGMNNVQNTINYVVYVFRKDTYKSDELPMVQLTNCPSYVNGAASDVSKEYYYNYQALDIVDKTYACPKISFNINHFEVSISRTYQGMQYTYKLAKTGSKLTSAGGEDLIYSFSNTEPEKATILLKDLGVYTISYTYVYYIGENRIQLNETAKNDIINIFGFEAFYSDYADGLKDFRSNDDFNIAADITYLDALELNGAEETDEATIVSLLNNASIEGNTDPFKSDILKDVYVSTNQAPVKLQFNSQGLTKQGDVVKSCYYFKSTSSTEYVLGGTTSLATSFSKAGDYIVKVVYCYENYKEMYSEIVARYPNKEFTQYFAFRITSTNPELGLNSLNDSTGTVVSEKIYNGDFTKYNVNLVKPALSEFDADIKITYKMATFSNITSFSNETVVDLSSPDDVVFTNSGKYVVTLYYGTHVNDANFSQTAKKLETVFTIDKEEISNVKAFSVGLAEYSQTYIKTNEITGLLTNKMFSVEWASKASGAQVFVNYQLIRMKTNDTNPTSTVSGSEIWINSGSYLDYDPANKSVVTYSNTFGKTAVSGTEILNESGLYLFELIDEAGHTASFFVVLDTSVAKFVQKKDDGFGNMIEFTPSSLNIVSNDTLIEWGTHKTIKISNVVSSQIAVEFANTGNVRLDAFYNSFYTESNNCLDFQSGSGILKVAINDVWMQTDANGQERMTSTSKLINVLNSSNVAVEQVYRFYSADESNTALPKNSAFSEETGKYSGIHSIQISTDMSQSIILKSVNDFNNLSDYQLLQYKSSVVYPIDENSSYISPSTTNVEDYLALRSLKNFRYTDTDSLYFCFIPNIDSVVMVGNVKILYYELLFDAQTKTYYYSSEPSGDPIIVYDRNDPRYSLSANCLSWDIYNSSSDASGFEFYYYDLTKISNTIKPGKYTIVRSYVDITEDNTLNFKNKYDYMQRDFTFFVDRNDIISTPSYESVMVEGEAQDVLMKRVGEYINLTVLSGNANEVEFSAFYRQNQSVDETKLLSVAPILTTNKLPVSIVIPNAKYGSVNNFGTFDTEIINGKIIESYSSLGLAYGYMPDLFLKTTVMRIVNNVVTTNVYTSATVSNGFLTIPLIKESGSSVTGKYVVKIEDGQGNVWYYCFEIKAIAPEISLSAVFASESGKYENAISSSALYTNADEVKVSWIDPDDEYLAKIDKTKVRYSVNGTMIDGYLNPSLITTEGTLNYFSISKKTVDGQEVNLANGDKIIIYVQYEGEEVDYPTNYYRVEREINIDYSSSLTNVSKLVDGVIIKDSSMLNQTRIDGKRFNKTTTTGNYAYYAYAIDNSFVFEFSNNTTETSQIYYKSFSTKYDSDYAETNLPTDPNAPSSNLFNVSAYTSISTLTPFAEIVGESGLYEIVEIDAAGNYTIYTVYLYIDTNEVRVTYLNQNSQQLTETLELGEDEVSVFNSFSLSNLAINGDYWFEFTISEASSATAESYRRNPFLVEKSVYVGATSDIKQISSIFTFVNNKKYKITITDRQQHLIRTIYVNISSASRRFNVSYLVTNEENDLVVMVEKDELLSIAGDPQVFQGTINGDYYSYDPVEFVDEDMITYRRFVIANFDKDKLYKITLFSNYNAYQNFYYVYGNEDIENEFTGTDLIYDSSFQDVFCDILSSHDVSFTFNNMLYTYNIVYGAQSYYGDKIETINGNLTTVVLKAGKLDYVGNEFVGEDRLFTLNIVSLIEDASGVVDTRTVTIRIYNILPQINLFSYYGENRNSMFNESSMTKQPVVVKYYVSDDDRYEVLIKKISVADSVSTILENNTKIADYGTYKITVRFKGSLKASYSKTFTITQADLIVYKVVGKQSIDDVEYTDVKQSPNYYQYQGKYLPHYITTLYPLILKDSNLTFDDVAPVVLPSSAGCTTTLYTIKNTSALYQSIYINEQIVVTQVPKSTDIITELVMLDAESNEIELQDFVSHKLVLTQSSANIDSVELQWNPYFADVNNKIMVDYYFENEPVFKGKEISSISLSSSGCHTLVFKDLALNTHTFVQNIIETQSFDFYFIKSVVFKVNGELPIDEAIYNSDVVVSIPDATLSFYDTSSPPTIVATRNGEEYEPVKKQRTYTFSETGYYEVYFTAMSSKELIATAPISFTIINPSETRWAFEYNGIEKYEIISVLKNDYLELAPTLINEGELSLTKLSASIYDEITGVGKYKITVKAERFDELLPVQYFSFNFWLNNETPPIIISAEQGVETVDNIIVSFNAINLYEKLGDCVVKVDGFDDIVINEDTISTLDELQTITIEKKGNYFVQVYSSSGMLVYSFRAVKKDPLNGVSIALIALGSVVFVALIFIWVKLRKRVKIR